MGHPIFLHKVIYSQKAGWVGGRLPQPANLFSRITEATVRIAIHPAHPDFSTANHKFLFRTYNAAHSLWLEGNSFQRKSGIPENLSEIESLGRPAVHEFPEDPYIKGGFRLLSTRYTISHIYHSSLIHSFTPKNCANLI